jgi:hypothetical protein
MRDGWGADANYLLLDCGPHGTLNCGHAHADALAFELAARGRTLLVDPGTYAYTASPQLRDDFRGTAAHNTLTLDGESSSVPAGPFTWRHVARAEAEAWISHARFDYFAGRHDGYLRLPAPARHARSVLFLKGDYWVVRDRVETDGAHRYELRFHFAPGAAPAVERDGDGVTAVRERGDDAPGLSLFTFSSGGGAWREEDGWVSTCYAERAPAPVLGFAGEGEGPQEFITFLVPSPAGADGEVRAREIEAAGGRAFEVHAGDGRRDLLLVGGATRAEGGKVETAAGGVAVGADFEWAWLRDFSAAGVPEELVLVGGLRLSAGGREIIDAGGRVGYAVARRVEGAWQVETDAGRGGQPTRDGRVSLTESMVAK